MAADLHGGWGETSDFQGLAQGLAFKVQAANSRAEQFLKVRTAIG
jgi:hypothetical protein